MPLPLRCVQTLSGQSRGIEIDAKPVAYPVILNSPTGDTYGGETQQMHHTTTQYQQSFLASQAGSSAVPGTNTATNASNNVCENPVRLMTTGLPNGSHQLVQAQPCAILDPNNYTMSYPRYHPPVYNVRPILQECNTDMNNRTTFGYVNIPSTQVNTRTHIQPQLVCFGIPSQPEVTSFCHHAESKTLYELLCMPLPSNKNDMIDSIQNHTDMKYKNAYTNLTMLTTTDKANSNNAYSSIPKTSYPQIISGNYVQNDGFFWPTQSIQYYNNYTKQYDNSEDHIETDFQKTRRFSTDDCKDSRYNTRNNGIKRNSNVPNFHIAQEDFIGIENNCSLNPSTAGTSCRSSVEKENVFTQNPKNNRSCKRKLTSVEPPYPMKFRSLPIPYAQDDRDSTSFRAESKKKQTNSISSSDVVVFNGDSGELPISNCQEDLLSDGYSTDGCDTDTLLVRAKSIPRITGIYYNRSAKAFSSSITRQGKRLWKVYSVKTYGFKTSRAMAIRWKQLHDGVQSTRTVISKGKYQDVLTQNTSINPQRTTIVRKKYASNCDTSTINSELDNNDYNMHIHNESDNQHNECHNGDFRPDLFQNQENNQNKSNNFQNDSYNTLSMINEVSETSEKKTKLLTDQNISSTWRKDNENICLDSPILQTSTQTSIQQNNMNESLCANNNPSTSPVITETKEQTSSFISEPDNILATS